MLVVTGVDACPPTRPPTHLEAPAVERLPLEVEGEGRSVLGHGRLVVRRVQRLHEGVRERLWRLWWCAAGGG